MTSERSIPEPVTAVLEGAGAWLPGELAGVEAGLTEVVEGLGPLAGDGAATLQAGGKRMRPMLVLLCAGPDGGEAAVRAAVAVEMIHMASLVHDDVLDRAPLRRGIPTTYATAGRERATALGDALFSSTFAMLAGAGDLRATELLSLCAVDLAQGELLQREGAYDLSLTAGDYEARCRLKTGSLFSAACVLGGEAGGTGPDESDGLAAFGTWLGLAFQLLDDVLDLAGPPERTGKARGTDLLDGTVTLPVIKAVELDPGLAEVDLRQLDEDSAAELSDRIAATGALDRVRAEALAMIDRAKSSPVLESMDPEQRRLLELVADGVVQRYS